MSRAKAFVELCLLFLIIQSASSDWQPNNSKTEGLCNTPECKERGQEYKKNLNARAHPCQDFYTFTCGNWQTNHPGPKHTPTWSYVDVANIDFLNVIRETLESYNFQPGDDPTFLLAKTAYKTCTKIPEYPISDATAIAREVAKISRLPETPFLAIHLKYLRLSGESSLFRTKILGTKAFDDIPVLMLLEPHSAYGSILHEEVWKPEEKRAYTDFLFLIMKSLKLEDSDAQLRTKIEEVFQFRKKLDRIIQRNKKKRPDTYKLFTGQELENWFWRSLRQITTTQDISWPDVVEILMQNVPSEQRRSERIVAIRQSKYFFDLMDLLKDTSEEVLASHMEIYFVERHLKWDDNMYKLLEGTSVEPHDRIRYIREKYQPRWQKCIEDLNMEEELEKFLYEKWFPKDHAVIIRELSSKIKTAIEGQMRESNWLDEPTREETTRRVNKVVEWIGFPPWIYRGGSVTVARDRKAILTPEASLALNLNFVYIHAPLLLPPMFSPTIPNVYNYAGMGTTLGHELYHVVDDCGKYVLKTGDLIWWEPVMRTKCLQKISLFINAYNKVTDREFKNRYGINVKSDTSSSVLENYPDVMGLEAAYNAYKLLAKSDKSVCRTLPEFEKYSCDQMFYIAYANTYCGYYGKKWAERKLTMKSEHSIESIRINGAVAQLESFATAFACPAGSPMNPQEKVNLWR